MGLFGLSSKRGRDTRQPCTGALGEKIGEGGASDVYAWAPGQVVKLFKAGAAQGFGWHEARMTRAGLDNGDRGRNVEAGWRKPAGRGRSYMHTDLFAGAALALSLSLAPAAFAADAPAAAPAAAGQTAKAGSSDRAQIAALEKRFAAAVNAKDVAKIMAGYARNGLFVYDATPPREYVGWEAYKKDWEGLFKQAVPGPIKFSISDLAISTDGNMAYSHSTQTLDAPGNAVPKMVVRVTDVYRKLGGRWQIVHEHVSVPVDMATGKGDLLSKP